MAYFYNTSSTYWGSNNSQYFIVQYSDPNVDPWIGPGIGPVTGGQLLGLYTNTNGGFQVIYSSGSPSIGYHVLIGSVSSEGVANLYLNKALIAGPTTLSTPIVKYTSTSSMLIGNTGNSVYATLLLGAMWSRELSISEIFSLSSNPTGMLIPA
jgi:hypothetical protein